MEAYSIVVIRHGESNANFRNIISDKWVDHPLTQTGIEQAQLTAEALRDEAFDLFVSSTRQRAQVTAKIVNAFHNAEMIVFADLIERDYGIFSGLEKSMAHDMMVDGGFDWLNIPDSETTVALDTRVTKVLAHLAKAHPDQKILISTHEDVIRSFYRVLNGFTETDSMALEIPNSQPHYFNGQNK